MTRDTVTREVTSGQWPTDFVALSLLPRSVLALAHGVLTSHSELGLRTTLFVDMKKVEMWDALDDLGKSDWRYVGNSNSPADGFESLYLQLGPYELELKQCRRRTE